MPKTPYKIKRVHVKLNSAYEWNGLTVTFHRLGSPEMAKQAEIFHRTPLSHSMLHGNTPTEIERSLVADVKVDGEHVYFMYSTDVHHGALLESLRSGPSLGYLAFKVAYRGKGYWQQHPTARIIAEALEKEVRPALYLLLG